MESMLCDVSLIIAINKIVIKVTEDGKELMWFEHKRYSNVLRNLARGK